MSKTNWSLQSKQKDNWSSPSKDKTAYSESAKGKTKFSESSRNKTDYGYAGNGSYSFLDPVPINSSVILVNEGECLVNGPLRITTYSDGKEKNKWS
jgi:hypothetical protein